MKLIYPAVFMPFTDQSEGYVVEFPDLPGCVTEGKNENIYMISEAEYNALQKAKRNAEYTDKLLRGISALNAGMGIEHELIESISTESENH